MAVSPDELAAYADGELAEPRRTEVAELIAADPDLRRKLAEHRALKERLSEHFAPIAQEPVPDRLAALLKGESGEASGGAEVVDFAAAKQRRKSGRSLPRWTWVAGPALAASLVLAVWLPGGSDQPPEGYAGTQLAAALDNQLVATQGIDADTRILLSFRDGEGELCRAFSGATQSGIACRDETGWRLDTIGTGTEGQSTQYRQAGNGEAALLARAQEMAEGPALDAEAEELARQQGWR